MRKIVYSLAVGSLVAGCAAGHQPCARPRTVTVVARPTATVTLTCIVP